MATVTTTLSATKFGYVNEYLPSTHYTIDSDTWYSLGRNYPYYRYFLTKLDSFPTAQKHKKLVGIQFKLQAKYVARLSDFFVYPSEDFNAETLTWYTKPNIYHDSGDNVLYRRFYETVSGDILVPESLDGTDKEASEAYKVLQCNAICIDSGSVNYEIKTVLENGNPLGVIVSYDSAVTILSKIAYKSGPKSGYANPRNAITFSWKYNPRGYCADPNWGQTSATFYWKKSTDANYTSVSAGTTKSVTIAANTFPNNSDIEWYVQGTDDEGTTSETEVFSFSTSAGMVSTVCQSPVNTVEDGSAPITLNWSINSTDGQPASRVVVEWRQSDSIHPYDTIIDTNSAITSVEVPGGTFSGGEIEWRVRAYNIDDVEGTVGSATFISVAAPDPVEGISATQVPLSTISWQSSEQQAYEVSIDGVVVKQAFGSDVYSYQVTEPLADGEHTASVRVQGVYGFWSQPSTVTITVNNTPTDSITLTGEFGNDAELRWDTGTVVQIYRDGVRIGTSNKYYFADRYSIGTHSYYVEEWLDNGNYNRSNTVTGTVEVDGTQIALLSGDSWLSIKFSERSATEQTFSYSRRYSVLHVTGSVYPVLELGAYEDVIGGYDCAFNNIDEAKAFEAMRGQPVIIKSRGKNIIFGAITQMQSHYGDFVIGYTFSVQRIHVEDFVDDTGT